MTTEEITQNIDSVSLADTADQSKLCEIWPTVKSGLQILSGLIKNIMLKGIIEILIAGMDGIVKKLCP